MLSETIHYKTVMDCVIKTTKAIGQHNNYWALSLTLWTQIYFYFFRKKGKAISYFLTLNFLP